MADFDEQPELKPETIRRRKMRAWGIEESYIKHLRSLPVEEAQWRIEHEQTVHIDWIEARTAFLIEECIENRPRRRRRLPDEPRVVAPHSSDVYTGAKLA